MTNPVDDQPGKVTADLASGDRIVLWGTAATVITNDPHGVFHGRARHMQIATSSGLIPVTVPADLHVDLDLPIEPAESDCTGDALESRAWQADPADHPR